MDTLPQFRINVLYLKEVHFLSPLTPQILGTLGEWEPDVKLDIDHKHKRVNAQEFDVIFYY